MLSFVAKEKALDRFLNNAVHADSPIKDRGAALCYCQIAGKNGLVARLEILEFYLTAFCPYYHQEIVFIAFLRDDPLGFR